MGNDISVFRAAIATQAQEYDSLENNATWDTTYESDFHAAFRVPAKYLYSQGDNSLSSTVNSFEAAFDKIVFHLDEAYKKTAINDDKTRKVISRAAEQLFHEHVYLIQARINNESNDAVTRFIDIATTSLKQIGKKVAEVAADFASEPGELSAKIIKTAALATIMEPSTEILSEYFRFIAVKWAIKENKQFFYIQLSNVYQKILSAECFSNESGLLRNTFARNKDDILDFVTKEKGAISALFLTKFDRSEPELHDSVRVIHRALLEMNDWEGAIDLLAFIRDKRLANYSELKRGTIRAYEIVVVNGGTITRDQMELLSHKVDKIIESAVDSGSAAVSFLSVTLTGIALGFVSFFCVIIYRFHTDQAHVSGFFNIILHFLSLAASSVAYGALCFVAAPAVVYIITLIFRSLGGITASAKSNSKMKSFIKRIEAIK